MTVDFRSYRAMTRSLSALSALMLSVGIIGCNNNSYDDDPAAVNDQQIESAITAAALDGVPQDIKGQIIDDLQGMRVTSVNTQNSPEGILYRVNFVDRTGQAGQWVYDRSGTRVQLPGETGQQASENVDGTLTTPTPAPSTQPSGQQMNQQPGQQQPQQQSRQQQPGQQTTVIPPTNIPSTQPAAEPAGTPQSQVQ